MGITDPPDGRPPVPQAGSDYDDSYGCLHGGLGRSPRRLGDLGPVVIGLGQTPHQLARAPGSMADLAAFPASGAGHCCGCPYGQFHHSGLYQQGGWNSVPHLVLPGTGPMGLVQATRDLPGCQPHIGSQDSPGGCPVQGETQPSPRSGPSTRQWYRSYSSTGRPPMWISSHRRRIINFRCSSQCAPLRRRAG